MGLGRWLTCRRRYAVAALVLVVAWALTWLGTATRRGAVLLDEVRAAAEAAALHRYLWARLLSFVLGRLTIPVLAVVAAIAIVVLVGTGRWRRAIVAAGVVVGANGTVQAIKHGLVPFVPGAEPPRLSGHMAMVVGAVVAVALAVPAAWRRRVVIAGAVAVLAVAIGVVVAWHTLVEMLTPTLVAAAWVIALVPLARDRADGRPADAESAEASRPAGGVGARS